MNENEEIDGAKPDASGNQTDCRERASPGLINFEMLEEEKKEPRSSDISESSYESGEEDLFRPSALQRGKEYINMLSLSKVQKMSSAKVI